MDQDDEYETNLIALAPIIALLYSLGQRAALAARQPLPIRLFILWIMRRAEAAARSLAAAETLFADCLPAPLHYGNSRRDAMRMALTLRAYARILEGRPPCRRSGRLEDEFLIEDDCEPHEECSVIDLINLSQQRWFWWLEPQALPPGPLRRAAIAAFSIVTGPRPLATGIRAPPARV